MSCGRLWEVRLSTLNDANVKNGLTSKELEELTEHVNSKAICYADAGLEIQIFDDNILNSIILLKTIKKGKNVNTKFEKSETSGTLLCVENSISVRRPKSKDIKSNDRVLKNTNDKRSSAHVRKMSSSVSIDSNKRETMHLNVCQSNASVLNTNSVNAVNDGLNIICVSCGKDVFLFSHKKCVARYALSRDSKVKRALFTTPIAARSNNLGATSIVAKSRLSVAKTPTATNKVSSALPLSPDCDPDHPLHCTVRFGNDHFAAITGYGDYVQGNFTICHVYYVEGLGHNLFSVGQFCDGDLEVAFRSNTCYVRNLEGDDLLIGSRESKLYNISISELVASSPVCLMSKETSTKSWLWYRRLSNLNFGTINQLTSKDLVDGLPKFNIASKLELLHMDLCGPMRVASINGKKYILVIVDDNSRYTCVYFLRTKDEASDMIINFINQVQRNLKAQILKIRTDNGTEFKNEKLRSFYAKLGIIPYISIARTPQQNGVVE
ncbi:retrovirus-related pol polyprotein from transposon TNT 1-94 [Tanacetum coccineum]